MYLSGYVYMTLFERKEEEEKKKKITTTWHGRYQQLYLHSSSHIIIPQLGNISDTSQKEVVKEKIFIQH